MKKNKTMRLASALLVLTLLSTSMISGTFAKYVTGDSAGDTARVAKFGVVVTASGNLFSDAYDGAAANTPATSYDKNHMTVASATAEDDVVAPGTKSTDTGLSFGLSGTPEVAVTVGAVIKARDIYLAKDYSYGVMVPVSVSRENFGSFDELYVKDATSSSYTEVQNTDTFEASKDYYVLQTKTTQLTEDYYPVVYTLGGQTANSSETEKTADKVAAILASAVNGGTSVSGTTEDGLTTYTVEASVNTTAGANVYAPNTDLATAGPKLGEETLTWEWGFENAADKDATDAKDTILGDMIAAYSDSSNEDYFIVAKTGQGSYTDVTYEESTYLVQLNNTTIASLKTSFDIELTVTQVD